MSKFFVDPSNVDLSMKTAYITGEDVNHIKNVLREGIGGNLVVCDGRGTDYPSRIDLIEKDRISLSITDSVPCITEPPVEITLFQGVPKSDKMELIIQKTVELGISRIVPVITERTVVRFDGVKDKSAKTARWNKIAVEASKQCNRGILPKVTEPVAYSTAMKMAAEIGAPLTIIPYEKENSETINNALERAKADSCFNDGGIGNKIKKAAFFIGPEGGFTEGEIAAAVANGIRPVSLGPRILRTETAGVALLAILMHLIGDIA
ncbi:MAG: 16S rRNA (uracil(1498)-N(3))-methyltransferase [Clostridiales bacterium]|nr:16S rRNA (uracil(1498)-N(3))-methyltransferase [Clostridiales bacterium]